MIGELFQTWLTLDFTSAIGYAAGAIGISSFLFATKKNFLFFRLTTDILFALHYFLIGALSGAYLSVVYAAAVSLGLVKSSISSSHEHILRIVLCLISGALVYLSYEGTQDLLILIASWVSFYMFGMQCNLKLRWTALLIVNPLWLIYAFLAASTPAVITLVFYQIATTIGLCRAYKDSKSRIQTTPL